jgi:ABC-type bacteriocin/lantibiotic exporter with double-glycine peptidase domain
MDEATSALDVATERRVLNNIMTGDPGRTVILTTHRPTVLNMCTRVYKVMDTSVSELTQEEAASLAMDF